MAIELAMRSLAGKLLNQEPSEAMLAAMAECYDPTWGYINNQVGFAWAKESHSAMRTVEREELGMKSQ